MLDEDSVPDHVYPDKKFLGGKQFQRAVQLLNATMAGEITWFKLVLDVSPSANIFLSFVVSRGNARSR